MPTEARPLIDRFIAALDGRRLDDLDACGDAGFRAQAPSAALAPVLDGMNAVLGRRLRTGEPSVTQSDGGGSRLSIAVPASHERGASIVHLVAARDPNGRWAVSHCTARSAAFEWVMR